MLTRCLMMIAVCGTLLLALPCAHAEVLKTTTTGKPPVNSIDVLTFAPEGVMLIGDGRGAQVLAIDTGDTKPGMGPTDGLKGIDTQIAGRLGTKPDGIEILDLAVNPTSDRVYIAVRKQDDKSLVIVYLSAGGKIEEFLLDDLRYARIALKAGESRVNGVTDVAWADDRLIVAGRSNEEFSSKIFSIDAPLSHEKETNSFSAETYHVSHRRWENKAPMSVVVPFKEDGKSYVIGAFSCTPVVKYPLDSIQPDAVVKGISMIELGSGNRPLDMFVYEKDGKAYVLSNTFRFHHERKPFGPSPYWTVKFEQSLLAGNEQVNEVAVRRLKGNDPATDRIQMIEAYHGVTKMDKLGEDRAAVLRETESGVDFEILPLP